MPEECRPKVLVVEDNDLVREAICVLLEDDFFVLTASTGSEALIILRQDKEIRVVTTSTLRGQVINGFVLARKIRNDYHWAKVILVTGAGDVKMPAGIAECFCAVVHKPFLFPLVAKIHFLLI